MEQRTRILIPSLAVLAVLLIGIRYFHYLPDDTFITLRYARNILKGEGLVFNDGIRLEGYTNFLWLMIITLAGRVGIPLLLSARALSLIFSLATLLLTGYASSYYIPRSAGRGWPVSLALVVAPALLAASAPFLSWSLAGTEIPLFTFLLLLGFVLLRSGRRPEAVFTVFGLLGLVRPEGLLFYALAAVILVTRSTVKWKLLVKGAVVFAILYAPYLAWKWHYFGALMPNTFYAKTGPMHIMVQNGTKYLTGFLAGYGYFLAIGLVLHRKRLSDPENVVIPVTFVVTHWLAVLYLGGDWMPHYRLLLPTMPIMALILSSGLAGMACDAAYAEDTPGDKRKFKNPVPVIALILVFLAMIPGGVNYRDFENERFAVRVFSRLGRYLKETLPPGARIGCGSTGAIGYYTDMHIVDILGLTEAHIARNGKIVATQPGHMKTDGKYVLGRKPDLLLLGNIQIHRGRRGRDKMKHKVQENDIIVQPEFNRDYEFVNIPIGGDFHLSCYKRRDFFLP